MPAVHEWGPEFEPLAPHSQTQTHKSWAWHHPPVTPMLDKEAGMCQPVSQKWWGPCSVKHVVSKHKVSNDRQTDRHRHTDTWTHRHTHTHTRGWVRWYLLLPYSVSSTLTEAISYLTFHSGNTNQLNEPSGQST